MKVATAHQILKFLRNATVRTPADMMVHKVASRWVVASMSQEYDMMIRIQVLEGLAGVPVDRWVNRGGKQGLEAAHKFFNDRYPGHQIKPEWWDPTATDTIKVLWSVAKRNLARFRINADPYEFINSALMGVSVDPTKQVDRLRPAYHLGVKDRSTILKVLKDSEEPVEIAAPHHIIDGKILPSTVAHTGLSKALYFRIADYADKLKAETQIPEDDKGRVVDFEDRLDRGVSIENFLSSLMFGPTSDPLADKVQEVMKGTWPNNSIIDNWFGTIQMTGEVPQANEFAVQMGISPQTLGQRHIKPGLERAVRAIWNNASLRREIEDRMIQEGVQGDLPETLMNITHRSDHIKVATSNKLRSTLASYPAWIIRQAGKKIR